MKNNTKYMKICGALVLLLICHQNAWAWTAEDANGEWSLIVRGEWYGGSYYQIMDRVRAATDRGEGDTLYVQLLRGLARDARTLDAILFHLESSSEAPSGTTASFIRINTTPMAGGGFPPIEQLTTEVWKKFGGRLLGNTRGGTNVELIRHQEDITIKGNPIATAGFKITAMGGDHYNGVIAIYRGSVVTTFFLDAPYDIAGFRLEEMWRMVRSIEFKGRK